MTSRIIFFAVATTLIAACTSASTQRSPALSDAPPVDPTPAKPGILEQATDATWRVVTSPAKLLPQKAAPAAPPQTYDAPSAIIVRRDWSNLPETPATTQPAHP